MARFGKDKTTVKITSVHCDQAEASKVNHEATMIATTKEAYIEKRAGRAFWSRGIWVASFQGIPKVTNPAI